MARRHRGLIWTLGIALVATLTFRSTVAADELVTYRIPPGEEFTVLAILKPYGLDDPVVPEYLLEEVVISKHTITVSIEREGAAAKFILNPPGIETGDFQAGAFTVRTGFDDAIPQGVRNQLTETVRNRLSENTRSDWWQQYQVVLTPTPGPEPARQEQRGPQQDRPAGNRELGPGNPDNLPIPGVGGTPSTDEMPLPDGSTQQGVPQGGSSGGSGMSRIFYLIPIVLVLVFVIFVLPRFADDEDDENHPES